MTAVTQSSVMIPFRLPSAANLREHHMARHNRAKKHRVMGGHLGYLLRGRMSLVTGHPPCGTTIALIRVAPRALDDDNLASAFKAIRDGVADALGIRDNDPRVHWRYGQRRDGPGFYGIEVAMTVEASECAKMASLIESGSVTHAAGRGDLNDRNTVDSEAAAPRLEARR